MSQTPIEEEYDFSASQGTVVAEKSSGGGDFEREIQFLSLKGDPASVAQRKNEVIVRMVTRMDAPPALPEWAQGPKMRYFLATLTVNGHYSKTKHKPPYANEKGTWPDKMGAGCRKDKVFTRRFNGECLICGHGNKASAKTYALAIEREHVIENGNIVGMRDKTREVTERDEKGEFIVVGEENGKKIYKKKTVPAWLIIQQAYKNFFSPFKSAATYASGGPNGKQTWTDRDYAIIRQGTDQNDTNYTFVAIPGTESVTMDLPIGKDGANVTVPYDPSVEVNVDGVGPMTLSEVLWGDSMPDLRRQVADRVSDRYFGYWFDPAWFPEDFKGDRSAAQGAAYGIGAPASSSQPGQAQAGYTPPPSTPAPATPEPAAASAGPDPSALQAIRDRLNPTKA